MAALAAPCSGLSGQSAAPESVTAETTKLLMEDARKAAAERIDSPAGPVLTPPIQTDAVIMDPFLVRDQEVPIVNGPPYELPLYHLLRTGMMINHVGKKVTTQVYFEGLNSPHGFAQPTIKIRLKW